MIRLTRCSGQGGIKLYGVELQVQAETVAAFYRNDTGHSPDLLSSIEFDIITPEDLTTFVLTGSLLKPKDLDYLDIPEFLRRR